MAELEPKRIAGADDAVGLRTPDTAEGWDQPVRIGRIPGGVCQAHGETELEPVDVPDGWPGEIHGREYVLREEYVVTTCPACERDFYPGLSDPATIARDFIAPNWGEHWADNPLHEPFRAVVVSAETRVEDLEERVAELEATVEKYADALEWAREQLRRERARDRARITREDFR